MFVKTRLTFVKTRLLFRVWGKSLVGPESRNLVVLLFRDSVSSVSAIRNRRELGRLLSILFDRSPSRASNFQSSQNSAIHSKRLEARGGGDQLQRKRRRENDARVERWVESLARTTRLTKTRMVDGKIRTLRGRFAEFHSGYVRVDRCCYDEAFDKNETRGPPICSTNLSNAAAGLSLCFCFESRLRYYALTDLVDLCRFIYTRSLRYTFSQLENSR